jgi:acyl-CoA thioesterase-1
MRNPIWIEEARAARVIHYSLTRACASLAAFPVSTSILAPAKIAAIAFLAAFALALSVAGCSDGGHRAAEAGPESGDSAVTPDRLQPTPAGHAAPVPATPVPPAPATEGADTPVVVFLGTSLTAGYGLEEDQAFPALIQERIDRAALDYRVINAGVSGDTSAGGLRRLAWLLRLPISVLVVELGANDMLRGKDIDQLRSNLEAILDRTAEDHPNARFVIAGMRAAPNLGRDYGEAFDAVYPALAARYDAALVPFLLEDVAARRSLNQADGIHPTAEGHALIAARLWKTLEPVLH